MRQDHLSGKKRRKSAATRRRAAPAAGALGENEERYRFLFEQSLAFHAVIAPDMTILDVNRRFVESVGYRKEEVVGRQALEFVAPADRQRAADHLARDFRGAPTTSLAVNMLGKTAIRTILFPPGAVPIRRQGKLAGILVSGLDITEQKRTEEMLVRSKEQWERTFDAVPDLIMILDRNHRIVQLNRSMADRLRRPKDKCIGKLCYRLVHGTRKPPPFCPHSLLLKDGRAHEAEVCEEHLGGCFLVSASPLRNSAGKMSGSVHVIHDITERCLLTEARRQSEYLYHQTIDALGDPVHVVDERLRITLFNAAFADWCRRLGIAAEAVGRSVFEVFPFLPARVRREYQRVFRTGQPLVTEDTSVVGGRTFITETRKIPISKGTKVTRVVTVVRDITDRWKSEEALRLSEQRYRGLFENAPISLWEEDFSAVKTWLEGLRRRGVKDFRRYFQAHPEAVRQCAALVRILDVNRAALDLHKAPSRKALLSGLKRTFTPESYDAFREELAVLAEGRTFFEREAVVRDLRGELKHVVISLTVAPGSEESLSRVLVSLLDITEVKRAEEALRDSEERYRTLVDNVNIGVYRNTGGPRGRFLQANPSIARMFGYDSVEEFLNVTVADLYQVPSDRKQFVAEIRRAGFVKERELRLKRKDGTPLWAACTAKVVYDGRGRIRWMDGVIEDITDRKRAERQLQEVHGRLVTAREQEQRRLAGELHDSVGQSLVALQLTAQNAAASLRSRLDDVQAGLLDRVSAQASDLIREVRLICHGLYPPTLEPLGLEAGLKQLAQNLQPAGVRISVGHVQALSGERFSPDMEIAVFRIAQEAVHNALRHSRCTDIRISLQRSGSGLLLAVKDNGTGFRTTRTVGNGLGLTHMRERAQAVGGTLTIHSSRNGTCVELRVPSVSPPQ